MSWAECTDPQGRPVHVNLSSVRTMRWDEVHHHTLIVFDAQAGITVKETPHQILGLAARRTARSRRAHTGR